MSAAAGIFVLLVYHGKAVRAQQCTIFFRIEAGVIERLAAQIADGFAMTRDRW